MKMYVIASKSKTSFYDNFEEQFFSELSPSCLLPTEELAEEIIDAKYLEEEASIYEIWISRTGRSSGEILEFKFLNER